MSFNLITTASLSYELPALDGTFTFAVVSLNAMGKPAPFRNYSEGSSWPLLQYVMSSAFLEGFDALGIVLSNDNHTFFANSDGVVSTYTGSGTEIQLYSGSTALTYDGIGTTKGTWKVTAPAGYQVNIVAGSFSVKSGDNTTAIVSPHSGMSNSIGSASITYTISGKTVSVNAMILSMLYTYLRVSYSSLDFLSDGSN